MSLPEFQFSPEVIEQFRTLIYEYVRSKPEEVELEDVRNRIIPPEELEQTTKPTIPDWMLRRLLRSAKTHGCPHSALDYFVDVFKYRKEFNIAKMTLESALPRELFQLNPFYTDGSYDREGHRLFVIRIKFYSKLPQLDVLLKHSIVYLMEQQDLLFEQGGYNGLTMIVDCQDFAYRNMSLDMLRFIVSLGFKYPGLLRKVLFYDLHWTLTFVFRMVEKMVNDRIGAGRKILFMVNAENLHEHVSPEECPEFLCNGPKKLSDKPIPESAIPFMELIKSSELHQSLIEHKNALKIDEYLNGLLSKVQVVIDMSFVQKV